MKDAPPSPEDLETLGEAYRELLGKALHKARQTDILLHHAISEIRSECVAMGRVGEHEIVQLEQYLKRDLADAAHYLSRSGRKLADWLGFDVALTEEAFWNMFLEAANKTTAELLQLRIQADAAGYHTGEITGLGTLVCDHCNESLSFYKPGHIPPCPSCHNTRFHRQSMV